MTGLRGKLKLHAYIFALAVLIAGGSGAALVVTYYTMLEYSGDRVSSLLYSVALSFLVFAGMVWLAKVVTEWATKTGRI